jgi:hypothetical protein
MHRTPSGPHSPTRRTGATRLGLVLLLAAGVAVAGVAWYLLSTRCCRPTTMRALPAPEQPSPRPADFAVTLSTNTGTVAPQYYHRIRLHVRSDSLARVEYAPGYDTTGPRWTATFAVADTALDALWRSFQRSALRQAPPAVPLALSEVRIGGGSMGYAVTAAGRTYDFAAERRDEWEGPVFRFGEAIRALLPDSMLADFKARQAALMESRESTR